MMIKRILTVCAAVAAGAAGISLAQAQQAYPVPPGSVYSPGPSPYPPGYQGGGYPSDYRRGMPGGQDFDALEDDDGPNNSAALPPPGPADDPRYGRPAGAPVYSDRGVPTGPVLSPDDPRYGRPAGPSVIYADRPAGAPQPYGERGYNDPNALRPPGAVGDAQGNFQGGTTGSVQPPTGNEGKPVTLAALPPEEQPEVAPAQLPPNLRRQEVPFVTKEPAGTIVVDTPNTYLYYVLGGGRAIRYGVRVGRDGFTWTGVQKITKKTEWPDWVPPTEVIEPQPYLPRLLVGGAPQH